MSNKEIDYEVDKIEFSEEELRLKKELEEKEINEIFEQIDEQVDSKQDDYANFDFEDEELESSSTFDDSDIFDQEIDELELYKQQLEKALKEDTKKYNKDIEEKVSKAREHFLLEENIKAQTISYNIGLSPKAEPDPFYDFEEDLRKSYYEGTKERKKITELHKSKNITSVYTLINDKNSNSKQKNSYEYIKDNFNNSDDFTNFGIKFLVVSKLVKETSDPVKKKEIFNNCLRNFNSFIQEGNNNELIKKVKNEVLQNLSKQDLKPTSENVKEQVIVLLAKDLDTPKKISNMEKAFNFDSKKKEDKLKSNKVDTNNFQQAANDNEYDVSALGGSVEYLKRQMILTDYIKKSNVVFNDKLNNINKQKISGIEKEFLIKKLKDNSFKIESDLMDSYLKDKDRHEQLKLKENKNDDEYKELVSLSFWVDRGAQNYITQKYILDDKVFRQIENEYPQIKIDVEERIEKNKKSKITDPIQQNTEATILAFSKQHKLNSKAVKKVFTDVGKEDVTKTAMLALKWTSLALNPAGFVIGQGIKKIIGSKGFRQFRTDFANRLTNAFDHLGIKKDSKLYTAAKVSAALLAGAAIAGYIFTTGDAEAAEHLKEVAISFKNAVIENTNTITDTVKDVYENGISAEDKEFFKHEVSMVTGLDLEHGSFTDAFDKFISLSDQQITSSSVEITQQASTQDITAALGNTTVPTPESVTGVIAEPTISEENTVAIKKEIDLSNLSLREQLDLAMKSDINSINYDPEVAEAYSKAIDLQTPTSDMVQGVTEATLPISSYEDKELIQNIMSNELAMNKLDTGIELAESKGFYIDKEKILIKIENNIQNQLNSGTFPNDIEINFTQVDGDFTITADQLLNQQQLLETQEYTVLSNDTLSDISKDLATLHYGENITEQQINDITDKIKVLNNIEDINHIETNQILKLPNMEVIEQYTNSNVTIKTDPLDNFDFEGTDVVVNDTTINNSVNNHSYNRFKR